MLRWRQAVAKNKTSISIERVAMTGGARSAKARPRREMKIGEHRNNLARNSSRRRKKSIIVKGE